MPSGYPLIGDAWLDRLVTQAVRPGWSRTVRPARFVSERIDRTIRIPAGFEFDWDSVPRIPFLHAWLKGRAEQSAALHDWLYHAQAVDNLPITRRTADRIFLDAMVAEGVSRRHRWAIYAGVRIGGWAAWRRGPRHTRRAAAPKTTDGGLDVR
ncbi:DUF1353 domain-containing protein [Thioalkalivibrio sp. ALR17-21]|nr:DUF1353 domain-containing protein [Thioalkalivibrio sp. ALR17-21]